MENPLETDPLNNTGQFPSEFPLYDCDTNKPDSRDGNLFIGAMTKNPNATTYQIGVENLLNLPPDFDYSEFYKTSSQKNEYGGVSTFVNLDKTKLALHITNLDDSELKGMLSNLKSEIERILKRTM